jgi:hypothetical protein
MPAASLFVAMLRKQSVNDCNLEVCKIVSLFLLTSPIAAGGTNQLDGFLTFRFTRPAIATLAPALAKKYSGVTANARRPADHERNFAFQSACQLLCHCFLHESNFKIELNRKV